MLFYIYKRIQYFSFIASSCSRQKLVMLQYFTLVSGLRSLKPHTVHGSIGVSSSSSSSMKIGALHEVFPKKLGRKKKRISFSVGIKGLIDTNTMYETENEVGGLPKQRKHNGKKRRVLHLCTIKKMFQVVISKPHLANNSLALIKAKSPIYSLVGRVWHGCQHDLQ